MEEQKVAIADDGNNAFLKKRAKLLKAWKIAAPLLLILLIAFGWYAYIKVPLLISPFEVLYQMQTGILAESTLELMAVILPLMFIMLYFLLIVMVVFIKEAVDNENKYRGIIEQLKKK